MHEEERFCGADLGRGASLHRQPYRRNPDPLPSVGWVDDVAVDVGSADKRLLVKIVPGPVDEIPRLTGLDVFS
jgi:hypothetical protein